MNAAEQSEARAVFDYFSREYAQALQAIDTIEQHAPTLIAVGNVDELRQFVQTFIEMADRTRKLAETQDEEHFAEWFGELVNRATAVAAAMEAV
jgi:prephenate dehydrogenase